MSSLLRSSKFIRYFAGAARNLVAPSHFSSVSTQLQQFSPTVPLLRSLAVQATNSTAPYSTNLERSLQQLDQDVRRVGRISRKELEDVLEEIKQSKNATSSQSLLVIRCCGSLVPEELPEIRTKLVQEIWATFEKLKVPLDISHYNALLRVFLENEHNFSPAEFLQDLDKKGVEPNRVTYQRLISRYCQQGDIEGATRILEYMREKSLPVNESVFNALIMGHSQAEDMESANGILAVMNQAGLEPSAETFTTLLVGYAKRGDMDKIRDILAECDRKEIYLLDKDHLELVYALAVNGYAEHVDEILARIRKSAGFNQDAVSLILRLVNNEQEDVALKVLKMMPRPLRDESEQANQGFFFIRQLVKAQRPIESILSICKKLQNEGLNNRALLIAAEASLNQGSIETAMKILQELQQLGTPIRQHYFWPLICSAGKARDDEKISYIISSMKEDFGLFPSSETIRDYVVPNLNISNKDLIVGFLKRSGISSGSTACALVHECLLNGAISEAADVASKYRAYYPPLLLRRVLNQAFLKTQSIDHYLNLIHHICEGTDRYTPQGEEADSGPLERREIVGSYLRDLIAAARGNLDLKPILKGLLNRGLGITPEHAELIQGKLNGEQLTNEISELLTKLTTEDLQATQANRQRIPESAFVNDEASLLKRIDQLEEGGQQATPAKRSLLALHVKNQEVDKALEIFKSLGNDAGPGMYAIMIEGLTNAGRLDEALDFYQKLKASFGNASLSPLKIVRLADALFKQDRVEDGVRCLEGNEVDRKFEDVPFVLKSAAFQALNTLAEKGDEANLQRTFDLLVKNNYVEVTNVILGPLVKVLVLKDDISGAIAKLEECVEKYRMTPWKNELTKKLIQTEDAAALQRITDISSKVHGEVNSLYDLVFAFVECNRIRQARKILETPGLRNRQQRLSSVCERYQQDGSVTALEGLVEATKDMKHIERNDIFFQLLISHIHNDSAEKAVAVWTQMQEEDVQPSDAFLIKLAGFLESKGIPVPFVKPVKSPVNKAKQELTAPKTTSPTSPALNSLRNAIKSKNWPEAVAIKNELDEKSVNISSNDLSLLLEGLCQSNQLKDAHHLALNILKKGGKINPKHFRFFSIKLAEAGEIDKLKEIGQLINSDLKKTISFDNKLCGAYLSAGRASEYMDLLLSQVESVSNDDAAALEEQFPRGAVAGIIDAHPELLPKFEQIAEKFHNLGAKTPANALWMANFLMPGSEARADKIWDKYQLGTIPRPMFQRILTQARKTLDISLLDRLLVRLQDSQVSEPARGVIHSCAVDVLVARGQTDEALDRLKSIVKDVSLELLNTTSLQKLKVSLESQSKVFPFTIPSKACDPVPSPSPSTSRSYPHDFFSDKIELDTNCTNVNESHDFFSYMIGFDASCLNKPNKKDWKRYLKDDSGVLFQVPFRPRCILNLVSVDNKTNEKENTSSSSSSDDDTEVKGERK